MIRIFDTTLRDGEQAPGFSMSISAKLMMAKQLEKLGVDVIEAGFPIASPDDFEAVRQVSLECRSVEVCGLARCNEKDIQAAIQALEGAARPRVHVFIATSDIHLEHKLKISRLKAIESAVAGVRMARAFTESVEFSPEDATRSDWDFLVDILGAVIEAGATTINIPDTVGYALPEEFGKLIAFLMERVRGVEKAVISTHCHDDLGLAVATSLAGVQAGARQVECTINGIGERAGNAALEEIVMAIRTRPERFPGTVGIDTTQILNTSQLLTHATGIQVQPNKAIVGANAFAHEAGIHQHGVLSNNLTYEIMKPEDIGHTSNSLVLGKHSGRAALAKRLETLGIEVSKERLNHVFGKFKELADKKKRIYDEDLILLVTDREIEDRYELLSAKIISQKDETAWGVAKVRVGAETFEVSGEGDGPVAALYSAIGKVVELPGTLVRFSVSALTPEREAVGIVNIAREEADGTLWHGYGTDTDITVAAGKALIDLLNRREIRRLHKERMIKVG